MAIRLPWPVYTRLDLNGNPVSGAQAFFYESETTKKLDTFSDEDLTSANANPMVANGSGEFGDIWLQQQDYKLILTSATDTDPPSGGTTFDSVQGNPAVSGDDFKASPQSPPDMTVLVSAGTVYDVVSKTIVVKTAQTSALIVAPSSDPRIDIIHVDRLTGVIGIDTGSENPSPVDPTVSDDKLPIARITLATSTTTITDAEITDIRELNLLGSGDLVRFNRSDIQGQTFTAFDDTGSADVYAITPVPAITAYAKYQVWQVDIANANTGASTMNINSLGTRNIFDFRTGAALTGGEMLAGLNTFIDDGTQLILMTSLPASRLLLETEQATTSGTEINFTGLASGARRITIMFDGVSTDGTANIELKLGDAGGIEESGYVGSIARAGAASIATAAHPTDAFTIVDSVLTGLLIYGSVTLTLEDATNNTWVIEGGPARTDVVSMYFVGGRKALDAEITQIRLTTSNGTDAFDAGAMNVLVET